MNLLPPCMVVGDPDGPQLFERQIAVAVDLHEFWVGSPSLSRCSPHGQ
jgi:hypothetical protein